MTYEKNYRYSPLESNTVYILLVGLVFEISRGLRRPFYRLASIKNGHKSKHEKLNLRTVDGSKEQPSARVSLQISAIGDQAQITVPEAWSILELN